MKVILIGILFLASAGFGPELYASEPGEAALLWIPVEGSDLEPVLEAISRSPGFHVTIAIPSTSKSGISKLKPLVSSGRLEVAMRLSGDPVLPLLFYPNNPNVRWENRPDAVPWPDRPDEMVSRLSTARKNHMKIFKDAPPGWVPAAGGVVPESLPIARALGLKWIATGQAGDNREILNIGGVSMVPFALSNSTYSIETMCSSPLPSGRSPKAGLEAESTPPASPPCFVVFDETLEAKHSRPLGLEADHEVRNRLLSVINSNAISHATMRWLTVSQAISESQFQFEVKSSRPSLESSESRSPSPKAEGGTAAAAIFPWTGDYTLWTKVPAQIAALANLNKARQVYNSYINSGQANWKVLRRVTRKFLLMEAGERLLRLASPDLEISREAQRELETGLAYIYRQIGKPVPPSLSYSLKARIKPEIFTQSTGTASLERGTTSFVTIKSGPSWITIQNTGKQLNIPEPLPVLEPGADPYKIWKLDSLRITWDDDEFRICFAPAQIDNSDKAPAGFGHILMDLYIDMNHRMGSGMLSLLEGRKIRTTPEDAWEYALMVNGWEANLFKAGSRGPVLIGSYMPRLNRRTGKIYVTIPRKIMRGNPSLWGYIAVVMAMVPGGFHDEPQGIPFVPDSGEPLIDILASERIKGALYSLRLPK